MAVNNAFWREVVDYLPNLIFVFRVDEEENAQLIFCNNKIRDELGYSAREFILASETEDRVQQELDILVDEVARRSHDVDDITPRPCNLTHKQGHEKTYGIDFRLFKTRNGNDQLIAVELRKHHDSEARSDSEDNRQPPGKGEDKITPDTYRQSSFFVCESDIMRSLLKNINRVEEQSKRHLLFKGEEGTGKRTLANRIIERQSAEEGGWTSIDAEEGGHKLNEELVSNNISGPPKLIIRIPHIGVMNEQAQRGLEKLIKGREQENNSTWILATTTRNLEERVNNEQFSAKLYYAIGFETLLIPPLRHRPEDIKAAARKYVQRAGQVLNLQFNDLDEDVVEELTSQDWPGNFPQLFKVLRRSLLESEEDQFNLRLKEKQQYQLFPEQQISEDAVLSFDQMNRKYLERVLELTDGKIYGDDGAAALLDLKPTTLQSKLKRLGIK